MINNSILTAADLFDDFTGTNGDLPRNDLWESYYASTAAINSNKVRISGNTWQELYCRNTISGDFDIQVDLDVIVGPATNSWSLGLLVHFVGSSDTIMIARRYDASHFYYSGRYISGVWTQVNAAATAYTTCKLRLIRTGTTFYYYTFDAGSSTWTARSSYVGSAGDVIVGLEHGPWNSNPSFTGDFDNFTVNYASSITPYVGAIGSKPGQNVWNLDYVAVYHLSQDPSTTVKDSTSNARNATSVGSMLSSNVVDGYIGSAIVFDGVNDGLDTGFNTNLDNFTLEAVYMTPGIGAGRVGELISKRSYQGTTVSDFPVTLYVSENENVSFGLDAGGDWLLDTTVISPSSYINTYIHTAATNVSTGSATLYVNGTSVATGTGLNPIDNSRNWFIGKASYDNSTGATLNQFNGNIQAARISKVVRSADRLSASYKSDFDILATISKDVPGAAVTYDFSSLINTTSQTGNVLSYLKRNLISTIGTSSTAKIVSTIVHRALYNITNTDTLSLIHNSKYYILQYVPYTHTGEYLIQNVNVESVKHRSSYLILESGIYGVTERMMTVEVYQTVSNDKFMWLHLYNTFTSSRTSAYVRYYSLATSRNTYAARVLVSNERSAKYERFYSGYTIRQSITKSYAPMFNERFFGTSGYKQESSSRICICRQRLSTGDERYSVTRSFYNTYRYCYAKSWHVSERSAVTHAILHKSSASQRTLFAKIEEGLFASVRSMFYEVCSVKFDLQINPLYNTTYIFTTSDYEGTALFTGIEVTPNTNQLVNIPINKKNAAVDLVLIDGYNNTVTNLGTRSLKSCRIRSYTQNTYKFDGYFVALKDPLYIRIEFDFMDIGTYNSAAEYYQFLIDHGYLLVEINKVRMDINTIEVFDVPKETMIPIRIQALGSEVDKNNINVKVIWAYPYSRLSTFSTLLRFIK